MAGNTYGHKGRLLQSVSLTTVSGDTARYIKRSMTVLNMWLERRARISICNATLSFLELTYRRFQRMVLSRIYNRSKRHNYLPLTKVQTL